MCLFGKVIKMDSSNGKENMQGKNIRGGKASDKQKTMLVEFLKKNSQLISGNFTNSFTYKDAEQKWQDVANILNSIPGARKEWKAWRKVKQLVLFLIYFFFIMYFLQTWQDLRSRTKSKQGTNKKETSATGGGPYTEDPLTKVEEDILEIIKKVSVEGHEVQESYAEFNLQCENVAVTSKRDLIPVDTSSTSKQLNSLCVADDELNHTGSTIFKQSNKSGEILKGEQSVKKVPKKIERLINSATAASHFSENLNKKVSLKEEYYKKKIEIMQEMLEEKRKRNNVLERMTIALEAIADSIS